MASETSSSDFMSKYQEFVEDTCRNRGPYLMKAADGLIWGAVLEMVAEAGEVLEILQKASRKRGGYLNAEDKGKLLDELGDVLWGCAAIANALEVTLDEVIEHNMSKLEARQVNWEDHQ